jgi:hypothetical protein
MEDFIKFIPIALYVIYKLIGRGKKKEQNGQKRSKPRKSTSSPSTGSLEDILRELTGQEPAPVRPEPQVKKVTSRKTIEVEDDTQDLRLEYEYNGDTKLNLAEEREETPKFQGLGRIQLEDDYEGVDFDLRQAIISEAILTRPQY